MSRKALRPDFRHVGLVPGPGPAKAAFAVASSGTAAIGAGLWQSGHLSSSIALTLGAGTVAALGWALSTRPSGALRGEREVAMSIVPWGVLVTPDTEPRVLRWAAIRAIRVETSHSLHGGTPSALSSVVRVETEREVLVGRTPGAVGLERLVVGLDAYAEEASRAVAFDLDGRVSIDDSATEPVTALLLRRARELCTSAEGAACLFLPPGGYRSVSTAAAGPETLERLRAVLDADLESEADPRPLAAMLAGMLDARELVPDLLRLVSSPHPVVAAAAKASALRLGAPRNRAGAVDEVAAFLFEEDLAVLATWAEEGMSPRHAGSHRERF